MQIVQQARVRHGTEREERGEEKRKEMWTLPDTADRQVGGEAGKAAFPIFGLQKYLA